MNILIGQSFYLNNTHDSARAAPQRRTYRNEERGSITMCDDAAANDDDDDETAPPPPPTTIMMMI